MRLNQYHQRRDKTCKLAMTSPAESMRVSGCGLTARNPKVKFRFNDKVLHGIDGESLGAALLANQIRLVGRSFKYHRPRGLIGIGSEEPNALVQLRSGAYREPNTRTTVTELYDGLECISQHHWGSLKYDLLAIRI